MASARRPTTNPCRCRRRAAVRQRSIIPARADRLDRGPVRSAGRFPSRRRSRRRRRCIRRRRGSGHRLPWRSSVRAGGQRQAERMGDVEVLPHAPLAEVGRLLEAAHTALVVQECTVWNRPPSMRSRMTTWPPASTMQHEIAILASRALSMAAAIILRAPSWVRRLASAIYMERWRLWKQRRIVGQPCRGGKGVRSYSRSGTLQPRVLPPPARP